MHKTSPLIAFISFALTLAMPAWAQGETAAEEAESPHSFSVTLTGVSDYVFRGVSLSQEDPALQASVDYSHSSGFHAGLWGSSVDFTPDGTPPEEEDDAHVEIDYSVGFSRDFNERLSGDASFFYYTYPGTADGVDYDYPELIAKLTGWGWLSFTLGYSWDEVNSGEDGIYYNLGGEWELPAKLTLDAGVGYFDLDNVFDASYVDWQVGISRTFGRFDIGLHYYDTNSDGEAIYGPLAEARFVLAVSLTID